MQENALLGSPEETALMLQARWVLPMRGSPIRDGAVLLAGDRILAVGAREEVERKLKGNLLGSTPGSNLESTLESTYDCGDAILLPGLINLHTHLDLSALQGFDCDGSMFAWVRSLMERRADWGLGQWWQSTLSGAQAAALAGTSMVVDSSYSGLSLKALAHTGLRGLVGLELFGLRDEEADKIWQEWRQRENNLRTQSDAATREALERGRLKLTVAPHAPYTVCPRLWRQTTQWAKEHGMPVLAHVSESRDECEWIERGNKTIDHFHDFVRRLRGADKVQDASEALEWTGKGGTPIEHLERHGLLDERLLVAHAVHVTDADVALLEKNHCKIAHCPRSNARLRNGLAPLDKLRQRLAVGLGTDSLASCDDLSIRHEAQYALNAHRTGDPLFSASSQELVEMSTIDAARAIGMADSIGSLEPGKLADIAVFGLSSWAASDNPYDLFLHGSCQLLDLLVAGVFVVRGGSPVKTTLR